MANVKTERKCSIPGCDKKHVAKGLCDMHRIRLRKHGHLEQTRSNDWGKREKHPLYGTWTWHRRKKESSLCEAWHNDFWLFVKDVGDRPTERHFLRKVSEAGLFEPGNVQWKEAPLVGSDEKRAYQNMYMKEWREANPEHVRDQYLKRHYGIDLASYEQMLEEQGNVCAICKKSEEGDRYKTLCVDHCHHSGRVRGLLCNKCNRAIGLLDDSKEVLEAAIRYLQSNR